MSVITPSSSVIVSYLTLRRVIGILGVGLPIICAVWGFLLLGRVELLPSISDYYGLRTRDAFVGILITIAWFLYTYRGHAPKDNRAGDAAGLCALGVALFPNSGSSFERTMHFGSAGLLLLILAYFSLKLFTLHGESMTEQKRQRNVVYRICGWTIVGCVVVIGLYKALWSEGPLANLKPVFWLETISLWAFGISWFIKGETLLRDR